MTSESGDLNANLQSAADKVQGWGADLGVSQSSAEAAKNDASVAQRRLPRQRWRSARVHTNGMMTTPRPTCVVLGCEGRVRGSSGDAEKGAYVRLQADAALPCAE